MALGDTLLILTPLHNEAPSSNYATLDIRNGHPVLDFGDAVLEEAVFKAILPRNYAGGGIRVKIHFAASSAVAGNVVWKSQFERIGEVLDIDIDSFAVAQSIVWGVNGTSGIIAIATITHTNGAQIDSLAIGESFRLKITRNGPDGNDTASGDAELLSVELMEG